MFASWICFGAEATVESMFVLCSAGSFVVGWCSHCLFASTSCAENHPSVLRVWFPCLYLWVHVFGAVLADTDARLQYIGSLFDQAWQRRSERGPAIWLFTQLAISILLAVPGFELFHAIALHHCLVLHTPPRPIPGRVDNTLSRKMWSRNISYCSRFTNMGTRNHWRVMLATRSLAWWLFWSALPYTNCALPVALGIHQKRHSVCKQVQPECGRSRTRVGALST